MHTPLAIPHPSIYFNYHVYPASPQPAGAAVEPVVVVGAGPVGLTTALLLARAGVRCVVLAAERQVCEGSRAIVFTRRSLEILQQAGAHTVFERMGLPWTCGNSFYRGQRVFRMETNHNPHDRFAPLTNLQQQFVEQALIEAAATQPLVEIRWGHLAQAVLESDDAQPHARLSVHTERGSYMQAAQFIVACDGAKSPIRSQFSQQHGLKLEGSSYEGRFVIADIRIQLPLPTERLAFFDPTWNPGNTVLMHRQPLDMWRVDYQLPPDETPEQALTPASLAQRINAQLEMIGHGGVPWKLDWSSVYSARALTLPRYRQGRVLFAGDAAHLLPIFGVRGANTGLQDAQNLAWKLAFVVQGHAPLALLDTYSHERVAAAREIVHEAGKSTRFMTPPTRGFRLLRDAVLSLSLTQAFVRPLYHWRTSRAHAYTDSSLNVARDDAAADDNLMMAETGIAVGEPLVNVALGDDGFLLDQMAYGTAAGFVLLAIGDAAQVLGADIPALLDQLRADGGGPRLLSVNHPDAVARYAGHHGQAVYLVRPDHHICARWLRLSAATGAERLRAALACAGGGRH